MSFIAFTHIAVTVALGTSVIMTHLSYPVPMTHYEDVVPSVRKVLSGSSTQPLRLNPARLPIDTTWTQCATVEVSAVLQDTGRPEAKAIVGVWVQAGDPKDKQLFGPRVKTDSNGLFHLKVDPKHAQETMYVFDDSSTTDVNKSITAYGLSNFINNFAIRNCESMNVDGVVLVK